MKIETQVHVLILCTTMITFMPSKAWSQSEDSFSESEISDMIADGGGMTDPGYEPAPVTESRERVDREEDIDHEIGQTGDVSSALHESNYRSRPTPEPEMKKKIKRAHKIKKAKKIKKSAQKKKSKRAYRG